MRQQMSNLHQQPSPNSDSDATGSSEGVDYYLQMYFGQSYDAPQRIPTRIAGDIGGGSLLVDDDTIGGGNRIKFDAQLASILFGAEEENLTGTATCNQLIDPSPTVHERLTRDTPPAPAERSSSGRWETERVQDSEEQQTTQHDQPIAAINNMQHQCLSPSQTDEPAEVSDGTTTRSRTTTENEKEEKITAQTQTQTTSSSGGDPSQSHPCLSSSHHDHLPIKFHQDLFNPFLSFPPSSSASSATSHNNNNNNNNNNIENYFVAASHHTSTSVIGGGTTKNDDIEDLKSSSSNNLLSHPTSSSISPDASTYPQFTPHPSHSGVDKLSADPPFNLFHHQHPLNPIRPSSFDLLHEMNNSSRPHHLPKPNPLPLDLSPFWSGFTPSSTLIESANPSKLVDQLTSEDEDRQPVELEFSHLVAEEQCAPSTPHSSSSLSYEPVGVNNTGANSNQSVLRSSSKCSADIGKSFIPADSLSSLFANTDQGASLYPHQHPLSNFQDLRDLNDTFHNLINSFDLLSPPASSSHRHSISSSGHPQPLSAGFLSTTTSASTLSTPIDPIFASYSRTSTSVDTGAYNKFGSSTTPRSPLPSPASLSYPSVPPPQSSYRDRFPSASEIALSSQHKINPLITRSASYSALNKSITAAAEIPTEVELAIPRLSRLNLLEPYPDDLKLLLVGLQAEGAKTRVETQIKLSLVLVTGEGASIDRNGNLSTCAQHSLSRLGNWSHIKLPAYSAIKRKSKKLIKTGIPPEETLFLDVAVVRESEPHEEIYCCPNCQVREQKRLQRKRDARVRPAQEIESDEAEQAMRPEDEKRKIVVFNCGQYVNFDSGEVTLPTRITCYCRHHREKKGFRVKITLRDHTNRFVATSTTPAIMITDDHKAVAAAAKAKSGSDAEDIPTRPRPIRKLPNGGPATNASGAYRARRKPPPTSIDSTTNTQTVSTRSQQNEDSSAGWTSLVAANTTCLNSQSQGGSRSISTTYKRKAPEELNLRANIGRRTGSNQTATSNQLAGACDDLTAPKNLEYDLNYQILYPPGSSRSLEECRIQLPNLPHSRRYDRNFSMPMPILPPDARQSFLTSKFQWQDCPIIAGKSYEEAGSIVSRPGTKPVLCVDVEMKDPSQTISTSNASRPPDILPLSPFQPLAGDVESKSIDRLSPSNMPEMPHNSNLESRSSDFSGPGDQADFTPQHYQITYDRPHLSCSTTTSSPDQMLSCPFGSRIPSPLPSGSSHASPKSSVDFQRYDRQTKFSNSTSRSSSIVCTRRACSDGSSNTSEVDRTICILPSQSESSPDQQATDHIETQSNHLHDVTRTGSPTNDSPSCVLGSAFTEWNVLSSTLPNASITCASPKSAVVDGSGKSEEGVISIDPTLNADRSRGVPSEDSKKTRARIKKLIPSEGPVEGGIEITILGENFDRQLRVDFGGTDGPVRPEFWSANTLVCILPASAGPGSCEVTLVNGEEKEASLSPPLDLPSYTGSVFRYISTADQRLMELALQVVGLKMTGQVQDAIHFARKIVVETNKFDGLDPPTTHLLSGLLDHKAE